MTITAHFPTYRGRVMAQGFSSENLDRRTQQIYVNRNNAAAGRRGDGKSYSILTVTFEAR